MKAEPSAEMRAVLDRLAVEDAGLPDPTMLPAAEGRRQAAALARRWNREMPPMEVRGLTIPGGAGQAMACRLYLPEGRGAGTLLHIHGGGFAFCDLDTHERAARLLAMECGMAVLAIDYRLAPEHPFPAGLEDCRAAWAALLGGLEGLSAPFVVAGDSAGANLAAALLLAEQAEGRPAPDAGLLFYGVFGADFATESYRAFADGPGLTRDKMMRYWDWYAPGTAREDALAAPLLATDAALRALPPLLVTACAIDPLRSDAESLHARLAALGREDQFHRHEGVVHGFMQMTLALAEARAAFRLAGEACRRLVRI